MAVHDASHPMPNKFAGQPKLDRWLLQVVDGSLAGVVFLVPLFMGGRHALGQLALTALAVAAAWALAARQCLLDRAAWRATSSLHLALAGLALIAFQIVPLPPRLLGELSPHLSQMLPLWTAEGSRPGALGAWPYLSVTPSQTLAGLVVFLDLCLLFFVAAQRIRRIDDVERLLRWCALSAVLMGLWGIVQLLCGNGKFFWFYEHPFTNTLCVAKGSFSNRNHFAQFLALGIAPLIWWLQDALRKARAQKYAADAAVYVLGLSVGIVAFAGLLSLSRGGIVAMLLSAAVCASVCFRAELSVGRFAVVFGVIVALIGASLMIFGFDRVRDRLETLSSGSLEQIDKESGRRTIWATTAGAVPKAWLLGTGVGSFSDVYPAYVEAPMQEGIAPTHAENGPLQILLETGAVGLGLTLIGAVLCAVWCVRGVKRSMPSRFQACTAAVAGSLAASLAHSLVDFVWYVPACMAMVVLLAACAMRIAQIHSDECAALEQRRSGRILTVRDGQNHSFPQLLMPRFAWAALVVLLTVAGGWMVANRFGPAVAQVYWDKYLVARHEADNLAAAGRSTPAEAEVASWIDLLDKVVHWEPTHPRAHLALAESHRRAFEQLQAKSSNPIPLPHLRDAAVQSQFPSREALVEWLGRAVGDHWAHLQQSLEHTRKAIALSPLEGRAYLYLADLSFLFGANDDMRRSYLEQAVRTRPQDGAVMYAVACEALLAGNHACWLEGLKKAFATGPGRRRQIVGDLVSAASPEEVPSLVAFLLQEFQPDGETARFLHELCLKRAVSAELLTPLVRWRAAQAEIEAAAQSGDKAARVWIEAYRLRQQLGDHADALHCLRQAVEADSSHYDARFLLASCLFHHSLFAEAETHFRWCLRRKPEDQTVENLLRRTLRGKLGGQRRAAAEQEPLR